MSGGGSKDNVSTTTSTWDVPAFLKPSVQKIIGSAETAFNATPNTPYNGPFSARPNQTQKDAVDATLGAAPGLSSGVPKIRNYADGVLAGDWLRPESNPYISGMAEAATRGATDNFNRSVLPNLRSTAISQGAYGGTREGVETALRASEVDKNIRDTYANIYGNNYANERNIMGQAPQLYGAANELALATPKAMAAAGDQMFAWDENLVKEALAKYNETVGAPWRAVDKAANVVSSFMGGGNSTSTSTTPSQNAPWWQQALQLGVGGLGFALAL